MSEAFSFAARRGKDTNQSEPQEGLDEIEPVTKEKETKHKSTLESVLSELREDIYHEKHRYWYGQPQVTSFTLDEWLQKIDQALGGEK